MLRFLPLFISLISLSTLHAQFDIAEPVINTGGYAITDTVYMDPQGDDEAPGTIAEPVRSFNVAVQKLPYGTPGINGGHAYGLVMLKEGHYQTASGFQQYENTWQDDDVFRNISVEGIGQVTIGGTPADFSTGHLLVLSGDHIFIRNITLRYSTGIGILLGRDDPAARQNNVIIEDVVVDSVGSFSMLLRNVDTILVRNCKSFYASRPGYETEVSPCQWPSGIKFFNNKECTIYDSEIAYTRGEGLNFHNSQRGQAFRNQLHDNGLNFYNDNSTHLQIHHNHIYNTPGIGTEFWRNCPADTGAIWSGGGMLIANEGACGDGNFPVFTGCATRCSLTDEVFPNIDSMFVYNNLFQNTGAAFAFWQGATQIAGVNCIRNVFIFNNTIIGVLGTPDAPSRGLVNVFFPDYNIFLNSFYSYLQNVRIWNNIFTYEELEYPGLRPVNMNFNPLHPGPKDIIFDGNLWVKEHDYLGADDLVRPEMPGIAALLTDDLTAIFPCDENPEWVYTRPPAFSFLTTDYAGRERSATATNVGALEYTMDCETVSTVDHPDPFSSISLFPNPCHACREIQVSGLRSDESYTYAFYLMTGSKISGGIIDDHTIRLDSAMPAGVYMVSIWNGNSQEVRKLVMY